MACLGSMASLARNDHVLTPLFHIDNIGVAGFTHVAAGKGHGPGCNFRNRRTAVVAVLAEAARHNSRAQNDECDQGNHHNRGETNQVFYVLEQVSYPFATF